MKKFSALMIAALMSVFCVFAESVKFTEFKFEADVLMKKNDTNPSKYGWRNVLYAESFVEEGSPQVFLIKTANIKKGYSSFSLYQTGGKPITVATNGKEQKIVPGKAFTKNGGTVWLSYKAPDKKVYSLPTDISVVSKDEMATVSTILAEEKQPVAEEKAEEIKLPPDNRRFYELDDVLLRDSGNFPESDPDNPVAVFAGINRQTVEKGTNIATIVKNLPEGTRPKIFLMDTLEVLVYIAPDMTLRADDNCYTLFYSTRRIDRDEDFSIPKRIVENPKINGKLTNMLDFDGIVTNVNGKKKLAICWTQVCTPVTAETTEEDLLKMTRVYWSTWKENDERWEKSEIISDLRGSLQYNPELVAGPAGVCLKIINRTDNNPTATEENPAFPVKKYFYLLNKKGHWEETNEASYFDRSIHYQLTDANRTIPDNRQYVYDKNGVLCGVIWREGPQVYAKAFIKSPDTKKMMWTESVPVIYQNKEDPDWIYYPYAVARSGGEWIVTFLRECETGYSLCVSRVNNEPCLITTRMWPNPDDMQHPGGTVHFTVEMENAGIGIAEGLDVIIRNEFKAEAGKVTYKQNFYPGTKYIVNAVYQTLKGKDGIVPVENIKTELKLPKLKKNSQFGHFDAKFTMGIPLYTIGDMFTVTKGKSQKVVFTCGTRNGVKVKASTAEAFVTEHLEGYEDNTEKVLIDEYFSDEYSEYSYDYETGDFEEPVFDFKARLHYAPEKFKLSGYDFEDLDDKTAYEHSCTVKNPVYFKESNTIRFEDFSFDKKSKVMKTSFLISNNWPDTVEQVVKVSLYNKDQFKSEQVIEIPVVMETLQNFRYEIAFDPALTDIEDNYEVHVERMIADKIGQFEDDEE